MPVIHGSDTPCDAVSRYSVLDRKIPELAIKLESVQEERENPFCIIWQPTRDIYMGNN